MKKLLFSLAALMLSLSLYAGREIFMFDNGLSKTPTPEGKANLLKKYGYTGILGRMELFNDRFIKVFDRKGIKSINAYVPIRPADKKRVDKTCARLKRLKGHCSYVFLNLGDRKSKMEDAIDATRKICDAAAENGMQVVLYPHFFCFTEKIETCMEIIEKADRKNLGIGFTLCHYLKVYGHQNVESTLRMMGKHLKLVLLNGANQYDKPLDGMSFKGLILPLNAGTFDLKRVFKVLDEINYGGPIIVQAYQIKMKDEANLRLAMETLKKLDKRIECK